MDIVCVLNRLHKSYMVWVCKVSNVIAYISYYMAKRMSAILKHLLCVILQVLYWSNVAVKIQGTNLNVPSVPSLSPVLDSTWILWILLSCFSLTMMKVNNFVAVYMWYVLWCEAGQLIYMFACAIWSISKNKNNELFVILYFFIYHFLLIWWLFETENFFELFQNLGETKQDEL